jgi:transcriptional regulator with XRE-family HTH domain
MKTKSSLPQIRAEAFIKAREKLGLSTKELGNKACLSKQHIEQLESGEQTVFYNPQIKFAAAKKVASLLGLTDAEAFDYGVVTPVNDEINLVPSEKPISSELPQARKNSLQIEVETPSSLKLASAQTRQSQPSSRKKNFLILGLALVVVFSIINLYPLFSPPKVEEVLVVKEVVSEPAPPTQPAQDIPTPLAANAPAESNTAIPAPSSVSSSGASIPDSGSTPVTTVTPPKLADASATNAAVEIAVVCPAENAVALNYKPELVRKAANMVYVLAKSKQVVCVVDATGKKQNMTFEPGVGNSFYGKAPFKVLTDGLLQVDIYFQGFKVRPSDMDAKTLVLQPTELVSPSDQPEVATPR